MEIITILISIFASIISGMVLFYMQRYFKRKEAKEHKRDTAKAKENILIIKGLNAVGKLTHANAIAIQSGKCNGEMHKALEEYDQIDKEMYDFLLEQNSNK